MIRATFETGGPLRTRTFVETYPTAVRFYCDGDLYGRAGEWIFVDANDATVGRCRAKLLSVVLDPTRATEEYANAGAT